MMQEFENLGLEILRIENTKSYAIGRPRALARTIVTFKSDLWKVLRHRYLFCFSETAHAPLNALERILYRLIKMKGIPLLIYVRDAHWLMPWYAPRNKEKVLKRHRRDMAYYNEVPDAVFVPTEALAKAIGLEHFVVLPPGAPEVQRPGKYANQSAIYVGGAGKFYDLDFLYDAFQALKRKHPQFCATLITRPKELPEELKEKFEATNTIVVAAVGDALADYYERSSVSLMPLDPDGYADLSMPVKLFEYLAYGLPVVSRNLREPAAFIRENECGVIADTPE
jgi:glycosyltransferase involved in cell wall biosynthesis